jgi:hypothetical protein
MRKKQKGGVIVLSKLAIDDNKSINEFMNFFLENSTMGLLTKEGAEGIILYVSLNDGIVSPFVKLNNDADPFSDDVQVRQLILKINLIRDTQISKATPFKKRTINSDEFDRQIERENNAFVKTFNGVESLVPTIFWHNKILKNVEHHDEHMEQMFKNVDPTLTFKTTKHNITYNLQRELYNLLNSDIQGIGICFYEMIERSQTVYDFFDEHKPFLSTKQNVYTKIFAKMIFMLKKGIIHGDHHESNILLDENSNIQFIDFARGHVVELPQIIKDAILLIETTTDHLKMSIEVIRCLRFIYDSGYYKSSSNEIVTFDNSWDIYKYIKKTITFTGEIDNEESIRIENIKHPDLAVRVCELVRKENAKQDRMAQYFLDNVVIEHFLVECHIDSKFNEITKDEIIELIKFTVGINGIQFSELHNLQNMSKNDLILMYKTIANENKEIQKSLIEKCKPALNVDFSPTFIDVCRRKVFESTEEQGGGSASSAGGGSRGGAKTKRRKGRKSKKRNNAKTKHRKIVGGGLFNDTVFAMPRIESNSPFEKTLQNESNFYVKPTLSVAPIKTQDNWISQYYNMDFAKTQETINKCFIQHNFFAGIIIILIKLGVIGNNPPSIILKTEKAKTIINNAIEYYKKLDKILYPAPANGASPVAFQPRP